MSDSIRKQIISNIKTYVASIRRNNAYVTDIGQNVYLVQKAQITTPAIIIWPGVEEVGREHGIDRHQMEIRLDGLQQFSFDDDNPSDVCEQMLGDLIEILTGDKKDLAFTGGGTERPQVGDIITGATSGATAIIESWDKSSGDWHVGDAAGTFKIRRLDGKFESENLDIGANLNLATTNGATTLYEAITLVTSDLADDIIYTQGGSEEYPDQGQQTVGASASFNIIYRTQTGNPYNQIT